MTISSEKKNTNKTNVLRFFDIGLIGIYFFVEFR